MNVEFRKQDYLISTDKKKLNTTIIHRVLNTSEWIKGVSFDTVKRSIKKSLCFGLYKEDKQIGFARIVSDHATISYISDLFILDEYRTDDLCKWLMDSILSHPELQNVKNWLVKTSNSYDFYKGYGFIMYDQADTIMIKRSA